MLSVTLSALQLELGEICLRLLCAMAVGLVIGTEREYTHRPAGMRTHILVALGACAVMLTGQMLFAQYSAYGALPDPARLGAQVITGVGFLGAGTIMREGANVKGLTTAASLWTVACLGLAAGAGYYAIALVGLVFVLITLTILEVVQDKLLGPHVGEKEYCVHTSDIAQGLEAIRTVAKDTRANITDMLAEPVEGGYRVTFRAEFLGMRSRKRRNAFFEKLAASPTLSAVRIHDGTAVK